MMQLRTKIDMLRCSGCLEIKDKGYFISDSHCSLCWHGVNEAKQLRKQKAIEKEKLRNNK